MNTEITGKDDTKRREYANRTCSAHLCLAAPRLARKSRQHVSFRSWLKRHPLPVVAQFRRSLVLTYAFPEDVLKPLLSPGLILDTYQRCGFAAIALVQTQRLRPAFLPLFMGQDFFLTGYRVFARYRTRGGRVLRGLRILRSDADRRLMVFFGNLLTHYNYRLAEVHCEEHGRDLEIIIRTPAAVADLHVVADLGSQPSAPPEGSPFVDLREARRFAGPLPFTFDYEPESHSIVLIQGVRENWKPQPIRVDVRKHSFFNQDPFNQVTPVLANAFYVENIPYRWQRGRCEALP